MLRETFPAVCRLVDERFFAYAAHEFICRHPPECAVLAEYGGRFPDFLAGFAPCRELVYLADVARLEWLMNVAADAAHADPIAAMTLGDVAAEDAPRLTLQLHPSSALSRHPGRSTASGAPIGPKRRPRRRSISPPVASGSR